MKPQTIKQSMKSFPDGSIAWFPSTVGKVKETMTENLAKETVLQNKTYQMKELVRLGHYSNSQDILIFFKKNKKKDDFLGWVTVVGSEEESAQRFMTQYNNERMNVN